MADVEHRDLTGADLHEPKGVASAAADSVYAADGAGSGAWTDVSSLISSSGVAVSGQASHGDALPLPAGFTFAQVAHVVSPAAIIAPEFCTSWECYVDGTGTIVARANYRADQAGIALRDLTVNYLTIGVG